MAKLITQRPPASSSAVFYAEKQQAGISQDPRLQQNGISEIGNAEATAAEVDVMKVLVGCTISYLERNLIIQTLVHTDGNRTHAARLLGISVRTLRNKLHQYKLDQSGNAGCVFDHSLAMAR